MTHHGRCQSSIFWGNFAFSKTLLPPGTPKGCGVRASDRCLPLAKQCVMYRMHAHRHFFVAEKCRVTRQVLWMEGAAQCSAVFPRAVSGARLLPSRLWLGVPGKAQHGLQKVSTPRLAFQSTHRTQTCCPSGSKQTVLMACQIISETNICSGFAEICRTCTRTENYVKVISHSGSTLAKIQAQIAGGKCLWQNPLCYARQTKMLRALQV